MKRSGMRLFKAEQAPLHEHDKEAFQVYEGCMPVEVLASRGMQKRSVMAV